MVYLSDIKFNKNMMNPEICEIQDISSWVIRTQRKRLTVLRYKLQAK